MRIHLSLQDDTGDNQYGSHRLDMDKWSQFHLSGGNSGSKEGVISGKGIEYRIH